MKDLHRNLSSPPKNSQKRRMEDTNSNLSLPPKNSQKRKMEESDSNLSLSLPLGNPSSANKEKKTELKRNSLLMDARFLSLSSSDLSSSGNGEIKNEGKSNQNSLKMGTKSIHQREQSSPKKFTPSTIPTGSNSLSHKKKILARWTETSPDAHHKKPSNDDPESNFPKLGSSNSTPGRSLPENPSPSTPNSPPKFNDVVIDEETFVPDPSSTTPYDPVTNYLSPRPKLLLYNPNRRRRSIFEEESFPSPSGSSSSEDDEEEEEGETGSGEKII